MKKLKTKFIVSLTFTLIFGLIMCGSVNADNQVLRATHVVPDLLTPGHMTDSAGARVASAVYDWLVRVEPGTTEINPELATSWETFDNAKTWTINLREGVNFHNGDEFNADDVIFTIERAQDPDVGHAMYETFRIVEDIEKVDDYTIEVRLNRSNPKFMHNFTEYNAAILSSNYDYEARGEQEPMGTGPFMVEELTTRESSILIKNPNYWMEGKPKIDEIHWSWVDDTTTQLQMLQTGGVDMMMEMLLDDVTFLEQTPGFKSLYMENMAQVVLYMRTDKEPFEDNRVRKALKYTIDQESMLQQAYGLLYDRVKDIVAIEEHPISPAYPYYKEMEQRERDIDKAIELMEEAGYQDGVELELYYASNYRVGPEVAIALQEMARPAGFEIQLVGSPRDIYLSRYWLDVNFGITGWGVRPDPVTLFNLQYVSGAPWNESHYSNSKLDNLIDEISSEADYDKRKELYGEVQEVFKEEGPVVIVNIGTWHGSKEGVEGYKEASTFKGDFRDVTIND